LPPFAREALFKTAPLQLWSLYNEKKGTAESKDHQIVLDMAQMLLEVERGNGHALYYAGEAYAKLGNMGETIRMLQHYLANAASQPDAKTGEANVCYERANGFCAERVGWVAHILADIYLTEALGLPDGERPAKLTQAFDYEKVAVSTVKWPPEHHHPGFDTGGVTKGNSSCKILLAIIGERIRLNIDPTPVIALGREFLTDKCGAWPEVPAQWRPRP
jgi:hypothetical protein